MDETVAGGVPTSESAAGGYSALMDRSLDLVSIYDDQGCFVFANSAHRRQLGYEPEELLGTGAVDLLHPDDLDAVTEAFSQQVLVTGVPEPVEHRVRHKDGSYRWVESIAADLRDDPIVRGILVNARDISDRRRTEEMAADQARVLELVARGAPLSAALTAVARMVEHSAPGAHSAVAAIDQDAQAVNFVTAPSLADDAIEALQGLSVALGRAPGLEGDLVVAPVSADTHHPELVASLQAHSYEMFWAAAITDVDTGTDLGVVLLFRRDDVQPTDEDRVRLMLAANLAGLAIERDRAQARLSYQASHDALTGLPNRESVVERLRHVVEHPHQGESGTAVLFLDIDRFKLLNDSVGHSAGDSLLVQLAARLREALRPGDLVARFAGDEFVMVCERVGGELDAYTLATRILDLVKYPFTIGGKEVVVTASVGIAMVQTEDPEVLLRDADTAMYWAKERGRARVELFDDSLRQRVVERLDTERELRRAIDHEELVVHYQPIVSLASGRLTGFECLLRWPHPERGMLGPNDFFAVAEETGLAHPISAWAREQACLQTARWREEHPEWGQFAMGVNLTAAELHEPELVHSVSRVIASTRVDPSAIIFEISERFIADATDVASSQLLRLRELGVLLALDDFGTGSVALMDLKRLPVDTLKVDRAFIGGLGVDPVDDAIVEAILNLSHKLDMCTIAEGVETAAQEQRLIEMGCHFGQGHRFAPALPADEIEPHLSRRGGRIAIPTLRI